MQIKCFYENQVSLLVCLGKVWVAPSGWMLRVHIEHRCLLPTPRKRRHSALRGLIGEKKSVLPFTSLLLVLFIRKEKKNKAKKKPQQSCRPHSFLTTEQFSTLSVTMLFETCHKGQPGAESQMTPRCYLLSSDGGKGDLGGEGGSCRCWFQWEAWFCTARK